MVKLQKPIPKKLKDKPKLDNPIKKQKEGKDKSATKNITKKLVQEEVPIKVVEEVTKAIKEKKSKAGKKAEKQQENLETKPVVAVKAKELKTNGAVEVKGGKKSKVLNENGSTKIPALPLKVSAQPTVKEDKKEKKANKKVEVAKELPASKAPVPKEPKAKDIEASKATVAPPKTKKKGDKKSVPVPEETTPATIVIKPDIKVAKPLVAPPKAKKKGDKKSVPVPEEAPPAAKVSKPDVEVAKATVDPPKKKKKGEKKSEPVAEETAAATKQTKQTADAKAELDPVKDEEKQNGEGEEPKVKREKRVYRYVPFPFDEKKFEEIVTLENIVKITEALKTLVQKEIANKKMGIFDDYRYLLQVGCFKIPSAPKRMVKVFLRHAMVEKGDDVLFIVPDLQRGGKVDYEPTKQHWEDLLRPIGLDWITVMPMNQLRQECVTFEQKRRLCASYDHFLCDGRIVSHVVGLIGKLTQRARMTLHAVRRTSPEFLQRDIQSALRRTAYRQLCKSTTYTIPIATHRFTAVEVAENVLKVIKKLKKVFPGGMSNVRNFFLKIDIRGTSALPFYISMAQPPEETPYVVGPREKRMLQMKQQANEVLSKFALTKEGKLIKLTKAGVEKKRKLAEMKAALKEEQKDQPKAKKAKKGEQQPEVKDARKEEEVVSEEKPKAKNAKKDATEAKKKQKEPEVKELELPENEEDDDDTSDDDDDDDEVQLAESSDEEGSEDMGQFDQEEDDDQESLDEESDVEILENGLADEDDEESDDEQQEDANTSGGDDDDDDEEDDDDDDEDDDEEDDESS